MIHVWRQCSLSSQLLVAFIYALSDTNSFVVNLTPTDALSNPVTACPRCPTRPPYNLRAYMEQINDDDDDDDDDDDA